MSGRGRLLDPMMDVERVALRQYGIDPAAERRQVRRLLRNAKTSGDVDVQPARTSVDVPLTASTTSTVNYQEAHQLDFALPEGVWLCHLSATCSARHSNSAGVVDIKLILDDVDLVLDSIGVEAADRSIGWVWALTPDEGLDGGAHTLSIKYKCGNAGTGRIRRILLAVDPVLDVGV